MMCGSHTAAAFMYFCARNSSGSRMIYSPLAAAMQGEKDCHCSALSFLLASEHSEAAVHVLL